MRVAISLRSDPVVEQRQPICLGCQRPLDVVRQMVPTYHTWAWDHATNRFQKHEAFGDAQTPYHAACNQEDVAFVESGAATTDLGLVY